MQTTRHCKFPGNVVCKPFSITELSGYSVLYLTRYVTLPLLQKYVNARVSPLLLLSGTARGPVSDQ